ncbi:tRNA (adenosine(37)-N6)-dimethylallyltransferase MiaA [Chloroflexota bacterium]
MESSINNKKKPLIAIVGPTATGKSNLALKLSLSLNGEIIGADSRQVYRGMDIGTAKLTPEEMSTVPHYLIDIINPDENFSLAQYRGLACQAINDIGSGGKLPMLVGGSGLYVWTVVEGWEIPEVAPNPELREMLEGRAAIGEGPELFRELAEIDPESAQRIDPRNVRRVIRALEVTGTTGIPFSQMQRREAPDFDTLVIGLTTERKELHRRIDNRVDEMIKAGLVEEVKTLLDAGYTSDLPALSGIGYKQIVMFLNGEIELEAAAQKIKVETHRLVRRQYNWFRLKNEKIHWFDIAKDIEPEIKELVTGFISE